jgi:secondary thiamine-phosphate synthase enzyme
VESREVSVETGARAGLVDLTPLVDEFLRDVAAGRDGLLHIFVPHATAGLVVMELGSGSEEDLLDLVERLIPRDERWRHRHGSSGHGADHLLPLMVAPALTFPVIGGRLEIGTWQSIALLDPNRDNPRRRVRLSFLPG